MSEREICRRMLGLGISPRHRGFWLICGVLGIMAESGASAFRPSEIYPLLGVNGETSRRSAERCMRYAIRYAWDTPGAGVAELFPYPPALAEFFCASACLILNEGGAAGRRV